MKNKFYLLISLVLATLIRIISLNQSLWLDEAIEALAVKNHSLSQLFTQFLPTDFNPPGMYLIHWIWARIFGLSEISLRMPSVIFGIATVYIAYLWIKKLNFSKFASFITMGLFIFSPLLVYYSQEARAYSLLVFITSFSMYCFYNLFREKSHNHNLYLYILSVILLLWSHYLGLLVVATQILFLLLSKNNLKIIKNLKFGYILVVIGIVPLFILLQKQLLVGKKTMQNLTNWNALFSLSWHNLGLFPAKFLVGRLPVDFVWWQVVIVLGFWLSLGHFLYLGFKKYRKDLVFKLIMIWLSVPVILGIFISIKISILGYFRFIFVLPALYLLFGYLLTKIKSIYLQILSVLFLGISVISTGIYLGNPSYHREDWRSLVQNLNKPTKPYPVMLISEVRAPFDYYNLDNLQTYTYNQTEKVKNINNLWLIKYAQPIFDPDNHTEDLLLNKYDFKIVKEKNFQGDLSVKLLQR